MNTVNNTTADIVQVIGVDRQTVSRNYLVYLITFLGALGLVTAVFALLNSMAGTALQFKTAAAIRGSLTVVVRATGTLQPVKQVDVGTEVSGTIKPVEVDYNDRVKVGQVLARLDTDRLQAQVLQSQATLESTRAKLVDAEATIVEARSTLARFNRRASDERWKGPLTERVRCCRGDAPTRSGVRGHTEGADQRGEVEAQHRSDQFGESGDPIAHQRHHGISVP